MCTNIMDDSECINMWHCLNCTFDFYTTRVHLVVYVEVEKRDERNDPGP